VRCLIDHPVDPYFPYRAVVPWPIDIRVEQTDWILSVDILEAWLRDHVGSHWSDWVYAALEQQTYWQACVAFRRAPDCTMFLLRWAN
jgi:hypothetical protein